MAGAQASEADAVAGIYVTQQTFRVPGTKETRRRTGFVARINVEAFGQNVFRFEEAELTADPTRPSLVLYDGEIDLPTSGAPIVSECDAYGTENKIWAVTNDAAIERMLKPIRCGKLVIGDGVARYEAALAKGKQSIPALFVSWNCVGLLALPQHRVVHGKTDYSTGVLVMNSRAYFFFQEVSRMMPALDGDGPQFDAAIATELLKPVETPPFAALRNYKITYSSCG